MGRGDWLATDHKVAKSRIWLKDWALTHAYISLYASLYMNIYMYVCTYRHYLNCVTKATGTLNSVPLLLEIIKDTRCAVNLSQFCAVVGKMLFLQSLLEFSWNCKGSSAKPVMYDCVSVWNRFPSTHKKKQTGSQAHEPSGIFMVSRRRCGSYQ